MAILTLLFGLLSGCLLAVLVGIIGSRRRIGFGLAFLLSLIFTPLVGLIITLLTDPLPGGDQRRQVGQLAFQFLHSRSGAVVSRSLPVPAAGGCGGRRRGVIGDCWENSGRGVCAPAVFIGEGRGQNT